MGYHGEHPEKQGRTEHSEAGGCAAGIPVESRHNCVNKVCGSGLKSIILAAQGIMLAMRTRCCGGIESMSTAPYVLKKARWGARMGNDELLD